MRARGVITALVLSSVACAASPAPPSEPDTSAAVARAKDTAIEEAARTYARDGDRAALARVVGPLSDGSPRAAEMWRGLNASAPTETAAVSPLEKLVRTRIDALVDQPCKTARGALVSLGSTAAGALEHAKDDYRLTRCFVGDDDGACLISAICGSSHGGALETIAGVAREISGSSRQPDATDIECNTHVGDAEIDRVLAQSDMAMAIANASYARGRLRVLAIDRVARLGGDRFLEEEATNGPVFAARMQAAHRLRDHGNERWPVFAALTIDASLRGEHRPRCDQGSVARELPNLVEKFPKQTLEVIGAGFDSYGPSAKCVALEAILDSHAPLTAKGEELVAAAMKDSRPVPERETIRVDSETWSCPGLTPSDLAAVRIGRRLRITYDCTMSAPERAKIVAEILAKRGTTSIW